MNLWRWWWRYVFDVFPVNHLIDHQLRMCFGTCNLHPKFRNRHAKEIFRTSKNLMSHVHNCTASMYFQEFDDQRSLHVQVWFPMYGIQSSARSKSNLVPRLYCHRPEYSSCWLWEVANVCSFRNWSHELYLYYMIFHYIKKETRSRISREKTIEISKFRWNPFMLKFVYI